ncbi:MAG: 16S rRNA (cytosine(967)-C(5))-methyltransferase RsmB [Lachnospiraceae bacterium]|nr:16S rRNA (cytosine(967)-C(5))-methyltransferase RsmB [Lachnospiraceae bacterium]
MTKSQSINTRELALQILLKVLEEGEYTSTVIPSVLKNYQYLEKNERAFLNRLCEGTIERMIELDYIINQFSKVKTKKMKSVIRNILRMSVYQMKYMDQVPDRAACNEAVKLVRKKGFSGLAGFVNGVLRNISRNLDSVKYPKEEKEPEEYLSIRFSIPEYIVKMWIKDYGYETTKIMLEASMKERLLVIRCNTRKVSVDELVKNLEEEGVKVEAAEYVDTALKISGYDYLEGLSSFQKGWFTIQDESSMLVSLVGNIKEGYQIIDVCAAPGGKSLHAAELLQETGKVSARDLTLAKVSRIEENSKRLGINNLETKVWDARILDEERIESADIVFADLPCSGLGVIGKKNDIKYKITQEGIESLVKLQREILLIAKEYVKPGGILIYSTCTVNTLENEENVKWFCKQGDFVLESLEPYLPEALWNEHTKDGFLQLLPGIVKTDGFFLARFRKRGSKSKKEES